MDYKIQHPKYSTVSQAFQKFQTSPETPQETTPSVVKVYAKVKGKLAQWDVATANPSEAIQTVKDVEQIKVALALIK